jgi:hydrogenase maturation factor HypF (carbamoyltransferase family)
MATMTEAPYAGKLQRNMTMLWFKQCPKCEGALYLDRDMYGPFVACLQCGYYLSDAQMKVLLTLGELRRPTGAEKECEAVLVA